MKFLHAADIHLDSPMRGLAHLDATASIPTREAFIRLVDFAIAEGVAFVLLAGDLYDGDWPDFATGLFLNRQMVRLKSSGIQVFWVRGNHDAASRITKSLRLPENVHCFASDGAQTVSLPSLGVAIHGQSYPRPAVQEDLSRGYPPPVAGMFNIGLLHTSADGRPGHEPYAPCSPGALANHGYDYWALGHVHTHEILQRDPWIVFPGCLQGRHVRECGEKGAVLVTVQDGRVAEVAFHPLDVLRWYDITVQAGATHTALDTVDLACQEVLLKVAPPAVVRLTLTGATNAHGPLLERPEQYKHEIITALSEHGTRILLEKVRFDTRPPSLSEDGGLAHEELLSLIQDNREDLTLLQELAQTFAALEGKLPGEIRGGPDGFSPNDIQWLEKQLEKARQLVISHLLEGVSLER